MKYNIKKTCWEDNKNHLRGIRRAVFIKEQNVPENLEWDEFDEICEHILVMNKNIPIACGRIKPNGHIGRMAVLKNYRNMKIGTDILKALTSIAIEKDLKKIFLHAQSVAVPFYEKQNFKICSEEFMDASIPHRTMEKQL